MLTPLPPQGSNVSAGALVFTVMATDADIGRNSQVQYLLFGDGSEFFTLSPSSGELQVGSSGIDFEVVDPIGNPLILTVVAHDDGKF